MKTPWIVSLNFTLVVMAEDKESAEDCGSWWANQDGAEADSVCASRLRDIQSAPNDWVDSLPFGSDRGDERTVRQILAQ